MNEWEIKYQTGKTLYLVIVDNATSKVWDGSAFVTLNTLNWATYARPMTETPAGLGLYFANQPTTSAGQYTGIAYDRVTSIPLTTDTPVAYGEINWNGTIVVPSTPATVVQKSYSSVADGDSYFTTILYADDWFNAVTNDKQKALNQAHQIVEQYGYLGTRTTIIQINEWPRTGIIVQGTMGNLLVDSIIVPDDIKIAEMLIAKVFLGGFDPELEARNRGITSRRYASVATTYDSNSVPEYVQAQCPSAEAWTLLRRYCNPDLLGTVVLRRVS